MKLKTLKNLLIYILFLPLSFGVISCSGNNKNSSKLKEEISSDFIPPITAVAALGQLSPSGEIRQLAAPISQFGSSPRIVEILVKEGDFVSLHYSGYIDESSSTGEKGAKFESSLDGGEPFSFFIGSGNVIPGWEEGLIGLCQGAKVTLIVPPGMAYGTEGAGTIIPGDATLKFDVHIISVDSDK